MGQPHRHRHRGGCRAQRLAAVPAGGDARRRLQTFADFTICQGQTIAFTLTCYPSHEAPPDPPDAARAMSETEAWWKQWSTRCSYEGEWRDAVMRSLITIKALSFAPTGGIV